ncbi:MAG: methyltransferase domain-containing protein [Parvibaculaceae bacterium]|nr:methyltransferase domain-containing protein [Parvibaculaceae bacterium]
MHMDVIDLRDFYSRPLGRVSRRLIDGQIQKLWPEVSGLNVLGLGFATPYLSPFIGKAERVLGFMPAAQGVLHWPASGPSHTALVDEADLPLDDETMDRVLVVHGIEGSDNLRAMLRQIWRVLAPGGRLLIVVPNRQSLWARRETTPFGQGQPFSRGQITRLLRESMFSPCGWASTLYVPPVDWEPLLRSANVWERAGDLMWPRFAGVFLIEATKQIYAATPVPVRRRRVRVPAFGAPAPAGIAGATAIRHG